MFTFEEIGGWGNANRSGWISPPVKTYLAKPANIQRPIVIQELEMAWFLRAVGVLQYIRTSDKRDDDFGSAGFCSQQVAMALSAGMPAAKRGLLGSFDPKGVDTPLAVYRAVRRQKLAKRTYLIWDTNRTPARDVPSLVEKIGKYYDDVITKGGKIDRRPDVRTWVGLHPLPP